MSEDTHDTPQPTTFVPTLEGGRDLTPKTIQEAFKLLPEAHSVPLEAHRAQHDLEDLLAELVDLLPEIATRWSTEQAQGFRNTVALLAGDAIRGLPIHP